MDYYTFLKLIKIFGSVEAIYNSSISKEIFNQKLYSNNIYISKEVINQITDDVLKLKAEKMYNELKAFNIKIVHILSNKYPTNLKNIYMPPLVIFTLGNYELLEDGYKKIYTYSQDDFSYYGKKLYNTFLNYIQNDIKEDDFVNVYKNDENEVLKLDFNKGKNIVLIKESLVDMLEKKQEESLKIFEKLQDDENNENNLVIFFSYINYLDKSQEDLFIEYFTGIMDYLLVPEARYKKDIYVISSLLLEQGKEIFVAPGNIYTDTSYFSNFLLKEGANVILNKHDIAKYINKK